MFPKLLEFGSFTLHTYSICLALGFYGAFVTADTRARKAGFDMERVARMQALIIFAALLGARTLFVLTEWETFSAHPADIPKFWQGGMVFYGGLIAALAAAVWYAWRHGIDVLKGLDVAATAIPVGQLVGRLGCFAEGCCYGVPAAVPWAVAFPQGGGVPRHPTQIYEAIAMAGIIFLLHTYYARKDRRDGMVMVAYLFLYAVARYVIELYRGDDRGGVYLGLFSVSQLISIGMLAAGTALGAWLVSRTRR